MFRIMGQVFMGFALSVAVVMTLCFVGNPGKSPADLYRRLTANTFRNGVPPQASWDSWVPLHELLPEGQSSQYPSLSMTIRIADPHNEIWDAAAVNRISVAWGVAEIEVLDVTRPAERSPKIKLANRHLGSLNAGDDAFVYLVTLRSMAIYLPGIHAQPYMESGLFVLERANGWARNIQFRVETFPGEDGQPIVIYTVDGVGSFAMRSEIPGTTEPVFVAVSLTEHDRPGSYCSFSDIQFCGQTVDCSPINELWRVSSIRTVGSGADLVVTSSDDALMPRRSSIDRTQNIARNMQDEHRE